MAARGNGEDTGAIDDPRDVVTAIADAVVEHEYWLHAWHRAILCGLVPGEAVLHDDAHLLCRFGGWLNRHREAGMVEDELFDILGQAHGELHEAARHLARKTMAGGRIAPDEYDLFAKAMGEFRQIAIKVEEVHGGPAGQTAADDDGLAALEGRLTMLNELERERDRAFRTGTPLCLMLVRPQGLLELEREYGRIGVDRAVIGVAARLFAQLRPYDAVYRYGRAEFLVSLPNTRPEQALMVARRLAEAIDESPFELSGATSVTFRARFGIASADAQCTVQEMLDRAIQAVDMTGAAARDRIAVWSPMSAK